MSFTFNFARMRSLGKVQSITGTTVSDSGEQTPTWGNDTWVFCYAVPVSATEVVVGNRRTFATTWAIEMRFRTWIKETDRIIVKRDGRERTINITDLRDVDYLGKVLQIGGIEQGDSPTEEE